MTSLTYRRRARVASSSTAGGGGPQTGPARACARAGGGLGERNGAPGNGRAAAPRAPAPPAGTKAFSLSRVRPGRETAPPENIEKAYRTHAPVTVVAVLGP